MLSVTGPAGFYKTPVNKVLLGVSLSSSLALMFPLQQYQYLCAYSYDLVIGRGEYWRLLTSRTVFLDIKDIILCSMLIYNFRFLERRFGSQKYVSYLLAVSILSTILEMSVLIVCHRLDINFSALPTGPFCLVFPQFVQFFLMVPRVAASSILGVPVTGKTFTYILGLQIASGSVEYRLVTLCAMMAGLMWHYNLLKIRSFIFIPDFISRLIDRIVGWLLQSPKPPNLDSPVGATLEIQQQERLERMEAQMLAAALRNSAGINNTARNMIRPQPLNMVNGPGILGSFLQWQAMPQGRPADVQQNHNDPVTVTEDQVQRLTEMGFSDDSVRQALRLTNNDVSRATNILLQDGDG